jgi:hypothetical protein
MQGDFELDQGNQKAIASYWHRRMSYWAKAFVDNLMSCDDRCCEPEPAAECARNFVKSIQNAASTIAIAVYSQHRSTGEWYDRPDNPDEMAAAIYGIGGAAFAAYDDCMREACGNS